MRLSSLESAETPTNRPGAYCLYSFNKTAFESIKPQLNGDDWFDHDPEKYSVHHGPLLGPDTHGERVVVWMHFSHNRDSGASQVLGKMSPDKTGEMQFLQGWNTGVSIQIDESGDWTSPWKQ